MKLLFQDPYLACGQRRAAASQSDHGFLFLHWVTSLVQALPLRNQFLTRLWLCFLKEWIGLLSGLAFSYIVLHFFLSLLLPSSWLLFASQPIEEEADLWRRQMAWGPLRCRLGCVGEEVSHQGLCRCWRWSFVVSVTHPWGVFFSGGKKIGFRDKRSGSHSESVTFWECSF